jgi:hypothetical protein
MTEIQLSIGDSSSKEAVAQTKNYDLGTELFPSHP